MQGSHLFNYDKWSYEFKDKLTSVFWITLFWLFLGIYQYADRYAIQVDNNCIDDSYQHWPYIKGMLRSLFLGGLFIGTGLVFFWEKWLRKMAFLRALLFIILCYTLFYIVITALATIAFASGDPSILIEKQPFENCVLYCFFHYTTTQLRFLAVYHAAYDHLFAGA